MASVPLAPQPSTGPRPPLQKPPGYRDPSRPAAPPRPPPRKHPLPASDPRKRRRRPPPRRRCRGCCCCCFLVMLVLVLAAALAAAVCYFYFQPRLPSFHLQTLNVTRFDVAVRPDGTFLDAAAVAAVQATNRNGKIRVAYGEWDVSVAAEDDDGGVEVGSGTAAGFRQGRRNSTVVKVGVGVKRLMVDDGVGTRLKERYRGGEARFSVEVRTRVGLVGARVRVPVRVVCGGVRLKDMGRGLLPKCTINLLKWINLH